MNEMVSEAVCSGGTSLIPCVWCHQGSKEKCFSFSDVVHVGVHMCNLLANSLGKEQVSG